MPQPATPPSNYQLFIHQSRYARWLEEKQRRETMDETFDRYLDFMDDHLREKFSYPTQLFESDRKIAKEAFNNLWVVPSMRGLMTAGAALARDNTCIFNCAYTVFEQPRDFSDALFILLCGTGIGYSVERRYISKLPAVPLFDLSLPRPKILVGDSKEGWATGYQEMLEHLWAGRIPDWDTSEVRGAGARLKTFGGRASGPAPLIRLFENTVALFLANAGRKLTSRMAHDIACWIADIVVVGGVRRAAMICLSDIDDDEMRDAKTGEWWVENGHYRLANNSAVFDEKPSRAVFNREWKALVDSKSGERGIFNRAGAISHISRNAMMRSLDYVFGCNPCSEILLRPREFCNLSEVVVRATDTLADLMEKVRIATMLGTWQASLTHFPFLPDEWRANVEEERLLGVSLTGVMDHPVLSGAQGHERLKLWLQELLKVYRATNGVYAKILGIPAAAAGTCVKPSGTVSQLVDSASGMHARYGPYYVRRVRGDRKDPLTQLMIDQGVPWEVDAMAPLDTVVFSFPMKSPEGSITRHDLSAIEQLEIWKIYQEEWCEHKPSVTVDVRETEWDGVREWVWTHFDSVSGIAFLPHDDHSYVQAPYTDCTKEEYEALLLQSPAIDWSDLASYENGMDNTMGSQTPACSGGVCELVDLVGGH
jgi:ribonucleoside-triphosphate reductase